MASIPGAMPSRLLSCMLVESVIPSPVWSSPVVETGVQENTKDYRRVSEATSHETKGRVNTGTGYVCELQQTPGLQQPDPIHKPLCPEGKTSSLSRDSPIPDTWVRTKYLLGTLRITILAFSDVIFQSNVLILRIEMPVFL